MSCAGHHVQSVMSGCASIDVVLFRRSVFASNFWSVSSRSVIAMDIEFLDCVSGADERGDYGHGFRSPNFTWDEISEMTIDQIIYPFVFDELKEIYIPWQNLKVQLSSLDRERPFATLGPSERGYQGMVHYKVQG